jgi:hypothetical protein
LRCEVCGAPSLPLLGACAFCRSPLADHPDASGLPEYLAQKLPSARVSRGLLGRGSLREVRVVAAGADYRVSRRGEVLRFGPEAPAPEWVDRMLRDLSRDAAGDAGLRAAMTRAGWALR